MKEQSWAVVAIIAIICLAIVTIALIIMAAFGDEITANFTSDKTNKPDAPNELQLSQENALKAAQVYLAVKAFSYNGLVKQLEFSQFFHEDAIYAADNCGADWNEQAVKAAASYLALAEFSRDVLINQLKFDGFTDEQAQYGVEQNGIE